MTIKRYRDPTALMALIALVLAIVASSPYQSAGAAAHRNPLTPTPAPIPAAAAATPTPTAAPPRSPSNSTGGMDAMSIDLDIAGNTATTLGPRDSCLEVSAGATITLDVTAEGIPASSPMTAFSFSLFYPQVIAFGSSDPRFLLTSAIGSSQFVDTGPSLQPDGVIISGADASVNPDQTAEFGSGVLARIALTIDAAAPAGVYSVTLGPSVHVSLNGDSIAPKLLTDALVVVGESCTDQPALTPHPVPPTPSPTAYSPKPSPSPAGPTQTPTATPDPALGQMDAMSIDLDIAGNTATTLGPRESCLEATPGDTITIDVTAENIPASNPMIAFTFRLEYPWNTSVDTYNIGYLLSSTPRSSLFDAGSADFGGEMYIAAIDTSNPALSPAEAGSGVLARFTLIVNEAAAAGAYALALDPESTAHIDPQSNSFAPNALNNALLVVGGSCDDPPPVVTPTPTRTPSPTPTPQPTPPTPTPTPRPTPIRRTQCPDQPEFSFEVTDLPDDGSNSWEPHGPRDILSITGVGDDEIFCLTITFAIPVDPATAELDTYVLIGFDADEESATGESFGQYIYNDGNYPVTICKQPGAIGAELIFDSADASVRDGFQNHLLGIGSPRSVPVTYTDRTLTVEIPLEALGGDPSFNVEVIASENDRNELWDADDCAPDEASIHSPDGAIVPPQNRDGDGVLDWADMCLGEPDAWFPYTGDHTMAGVVALSDFKQRPIALPHRREEVVKFQGSLAMENLNDWSCWTTVSVYIGDLGAECQLRSADGWSRYGGRVVAEQILLGPHERRKLRWNSAIQCDESTPSGNRILSIDASANHFIWEYGWLVADAETTATLRVR